MTTSTSTIPRPPLIGFATQLDAFLAAVHYSGRDGRRRRVFQSEHAVPGRWLVQTIGRPRKVGA